MADEKEKDFCNVAYLLGEAYIENICEGAVEDCIKENADFHYQAGMKPRVVRTSSGFCCEWCSDLEGVYEYPDVPKEVWMIHRNCNCTVEYDPADGKGLVQNVHAKEWREHRIVQINDEELLNRQIPKNLQNPKVFGSRLNIIAYRAQEGEYGVWISARSNIKAQGLSNIEKGITDSLERLGFRNEWSKNKPEIIIVGQSEMNKGVLASYNYINNQLYLNETLGNKSSTIETQIKGNLADPKSPFSTTRHELIHWQRSQQYVEKYGAITAANRDKYLSDMNDLAHEELDNTGVSLYDLSSISSYAKDAYLLNEYDEALTEYRVHITSGRL